MKNEIYQKNSINLWGAVGLGTGVMFGAAIFAVFGQVAELAGTLLPLAYIGGAIIAAFSAYTYVKMANVYPSAGGIGMFFVKVYGKTTITATCDRFPSNGIFHGYRSEPCCPYFWDVHTPAFQYRTRKLACTRIRSGIAYFYLFG